MGAKVDKIAMVQYGIDTGASDKDIAFHFGYKDVKVWRSYKSEVKRTNPELVEQLNQAQASKGNRRKIEKMNGKLTLDKMAMLQYGIKTGASDEEIANEFKCNRVATWLTYKALLKKEYPELVKQLKQAQKEKKQREKENIPTYKELQSENTELKARIVWLEKELDDYRMGIKGTAKDIKRQMPHSSETELDVLLRTFNKGKASYSDAEILLQYEHRLEEQQRKIERAKKGQNLLNYSTMISSIRVILSMRNIKYQEQTIPELKKFISPVNYGPLYEIENDTTIGRLANQIQKLTGKRVSILELVMVINQLRAEGLSEEISGKINIDGISNIRSRLEDCYEKIEQDKMLLIGKER